MHNFKPVTLGIGAFLYSLMGLHSAMADDTEIYVPKDLPADQYVRPNILFILDSSGSMSSDVAGTDNGTGSWVKNKKTGVSTWVPNPKSRNEVLHEVVDDLIDEIKVKEDVNVGFMRYDGSNGGYVLSPLQRLTNANASTMQTVVNNIPASGNTPLLETYYESYLYMTGQKPVWGTKSVASSIANKKYILPITHSCQKSHIIYVTDGEPTSDTGSNTAVRSLVAGKNTLFPSTSCGTGDGACLPHLAEYMANQDLVPPPTPFDDPTNRKQTVTSHFIGFTTDQTLLSDAAKGGGGHYYTSDNVTGLTAALKAIIVDITADNTSFAAPSVAVSAFNNLGFRNDLYYALFRPQGGARWPGNVKRYELDKDSSGNPLIVDKNGSAAIEDSTGFFKDGSSSFWSNADGADVAKGGVAGQLLTPDSRKLFTWTAADRTPSASAGVTGSVALDVAAHQLLNSNNLITQAMLGVATTGTPANDIATRTTYINWARGKNTDGSARLSIADVLHNEPKLVAYVTEEDLTRADTASSPEQLYMFFGSNEGFIHAINPVNGQEKFAFIPKELLANPGAYYTNQQGTQNKKYGMDGQINLWTEYSALDTGSNTRTLTKAYLYAGMRRGGSNYYALDVTNINSPAFKWVIKGPVQNAPVSPSLLYSNATSGFTPGYAKLGETFSAPKLAKIKVNGVETKVLIFTGGYDLDQDTVGTNIPKNDDIGNALFIADADTGKLIWSASNSGANLNIATMTNSMPADPTIADVNGDGLADIIYTSDLRGQIFRFDINSANTGAGNFATGGRIASLGGATAADNRRFFTSPDVALLRERGGKTYLTISIGSGFRASPLNTDTNDRFYVLRDTNVTSAPSTYTTITESDLLDASSVDLSNSQTTLDAIKVLEDKITALNSAVTTSQNNFTGYKTTSGYTAISTDALQTKSDANDKQKQIEALLANDPYLVVRAPNTSEQSILQDSLTRARDVLAGVEQARITAQTQADLTDATGLNAAATAAATALTGATTTYDAAKLVSDADAATASSTNATANTAEATSATAATAAATALTNKTTADAAAAAAVTDAGLKATAKSDADAAKTSADTIAASKLAAKTAADSALDTANADAATALSNKSAADAALATAQGNVATALATKTTADNAVTSATSDLTAATAAKTAADNALSTATGNTAAALTAKNTADQNLVDAQTALGLDPLNPALITARDAAANAATNAGNAYTNAQNAEANATTVAGSAATDKTNATNALAIATTAAGTADGAYLAAQAALTTPAADATAAGTAYGLAQSAAAAAATAAATATTENTTAQNAAIAAATAATAANTAKITADALVVSTANAATAAAATLLTANATAASTAATATAARATANAAAAVATTSAADTAAKLTAKTAAQNAKTAADLALSNGTADDAAALALTTQSNRMATEYETLINLQTSADSAYDAILAREALIVANNGVDPTQDPVVTGPSLASLRATYDALPSVVQRANLNTGSPSLAVAQLNAVNAALSAGTPAQIAAALNTALTTLESSFGSPAAATTTTALLLTRDEASKSSTLFEKASNEASTAALIASLQSQIATLLTTASTYQTKADTLAAGKYDTATGLLTTAQFNAATASGKYSSPLTTFDAYQYLEDIALAAANDTTSGLPALRVQINDKYNTLSPGNSYTPNPTLLALSKGFYLKLIKGEKVLSSSISFRGAVLFSTFSPRGAATSSCGSDVGRGRTYAISLTDASAIFATVVNGVKTPVRYVDLVRSGIPPTPSVILSDGKPAFLTGTEVLNDGGLDCVDGVEACRANEAVKGTYWREN